MVSLKTVSLGLASLAVTPANGLLCKTESQPNPIAAQYPNVPTGTINGTVAILPIPYALARSIIPSEYNILKNAYQSLFGSSLGHEMYPAMLQSELDHDVQSSGFKIPDFTRSSISFPFVDRLGDGYTSMTYGDQILISALNLLAIAGTEVYGNKVTPGRFDPECDAYRCGDENDDCATKYFAAYGALQLSGPPHISHNFTDGQGKSPFSLAVYKNITNQPQFSSNKSICDNYVRLFNASVTRAPYEPAFVKGTVSVQKPFFAESKTWEHVWGLQLDNAFIEHNYVNCSSLQGYTFSD